MATTYTKRTEPTTTYVKRLRRKDWTWEESNPLTWDDIDETWEELGETDYTERIKPTTTYTKRTKP